MDKDTLKLANEYNKEIIKLEDKLVFIKKAIDNAIENPDKFSTSFSVNANGCAFEIRANKDYYSDELLGRLVEDAQMHLCLIASRYEWRISILKQRLERL